MKLLLYCTKGKEILWWNKKLDKGYQFFMDGRYNRLLDDCPNFLLNGKVVGECDFEVEEIIANDVNLYDEYGIKYTTKNGYSCIDDNFEALLDDSCLNAFELNEYLGGYGGYAIHIKNLHIFDEPKKLNEFYSIHNVGGMLLTDKLTKAPQNMQRVSPCDWEYGTYNPNDIAVLISIHPEWLCKILNGIKTIEIRKKVLKGML